VSLLKTFKGKLPEGEAPEDAVALDFENVPVYALEAILATRIGTRRQSEFLCKWVGFSYDHNSWELADNLPQGMVADFWSTSRAAAGEQVF
jgi:hypothetical protein